MFRQPRRRRGAPVQSAWRLLATLRPHLALLFHIGGNRCASLFSSAVPTLPGFLKVARGPQSRFVGELGPSFFSPSITPFVATVCIRNRLASYRSCLQSFVRSHVAKPRPLVLSCAVGDVMKHKNSMLLQMFVLNFTYAGSWSHLLVQSSFPGQSRTASAIEIRYQIKHGTG